MYNCTEERIDSQEKVFWEHNPQEEEEFRLERRKDVC